MWYSCFIAPIKQLISVLYSHKKKKHEAIEYYCYEALDCLTQIIDNSPCFNNAYSNSIYTIET